MSDGRWLTTHDSTHGKPCGWELWVRNAALELRPGKDAQPEPCGSDLDDDTFEGTVSEELGWCACGDPKDVDRMMLAYLTNINERWTVRNDEGPPLFGRRPTPGMSEDAAELIAYIADSLDWTEHGTSIGGAWLTENGLTALANLRKRAADPR